MAEDKLCGGPEAAYQTVLGGCDRAARQRLDAMIIEHLAHHKSRVESLEALYALMRTMTPEQERSLSKLPWFRLLEENR